MSTRRILNLYRKAGGAAKREGMNWYADANRFALHLASTYGVTVEKCAGVISALSPGITWETNKRDAEILIAGVCAGILVDDQKQTHRFSTYWRNVVKAEQILFTEGPVVDLFSERTGPKTLAFFLNILHPTKATRVTIDRHAIAIWSGDGESGRRGIHLAQYKRIEADYVKAAKKIGILPHTLQAVTWVMYKRIKNL